MREEYIFKGKLNIKINKSDLSKWTGISRTTLRKILNCEQKCSKPFAKIIAEYLGKTIEDFFERV